MSAEKAISDVDSTLKNAAGADNSDNALLVDEPAEVAERRMSPVAMTFLLIGLGLVALGYSKALRQRMKAT